MPLYNKRFKPSDLPLYDLKKVDWIVYKIPVLTKDDLRKIWNNLFFHQGEKTAGSFSKQRKYRNANQYTVLGSNLHQRWSAVVSVLSVTAGVTHQDSRDDKVGEG